MPSQIYLFFIGYKRKEAEFEEVTYVSGISNIYAINIWCLVEDIKNDEWVDAYLYLKQRIDSSM